MRTTIHLPRTPKTRSRAFTLIELMVAVGLLVLLIAGVGVVFKSASSAVGLSEATGDVFAQVRAINQQIETDIRGINKNGFLVIRCRAEATADKDYDANNFRFRRYDQISFISTGKFPNRTGAFQTFNLFGDTTTSNIARIWYGQLYVEKDSAAGPDETNAVGINYPPTSLIGPHTPATTTTPTLPTLGQPLDPAYESGFMLGRQAMLILNAPPTGITPYPSGYGSISQYVLPGTSPTPFAASASPPTAPFVNAPTNTAPDNKLTSITASRVDVAYTSLSKEMASIGGASNKDIAAAMCYRLKVLPSANQTSVANVGIPYLPNGVFRMHPILAKGVASFAVDWTDGSTDVTTKNLRWYGLNDGATGSYAIDSTAGVQPYGAGIDTGAGSTIPGDANGSDGYCAVFKPANAASWPKALRFTYRITDPNDRLNGGRTFVCVVDLP